MGQKGYVDTMLAEIEQSGAQSLVGTPIGNNIFPHLTLEESIVFRWQYPGQSGGFGEFFTHLMHAVIKADDSNLLRLSMGFKEMVIGLIKFRCVPGWWQELETKLERLDYIAVAGEDKRVRSHETV